MQRLKRAYGFRDAFKFVADVTGEVGGAAMERGVTALAGAALVRELTGLGLAASGRPPVVLVPGFGMGERHLESLRQFLEDMGHAAYPWGQGVNTGLKPGTLGALEARLEEISARHGGVKVALVGESLGGLMAQEMDCARPDLVRRTITLGTPRLGIGMPGNVSLFARAAYAALNPWSAKLLTCPDAALRFATPPDNGVPKTAIVSRLDRVTRFEAALMPADAPLTENVEVSSTHVGMSYNPFVRRVIADRLVAGEGGCWRPFAPEGHGSPGLAIRTVPADELPRRAGPGATATPLPLPPPGPEGDSAVDELVAASNRFRNVF